MNENEWTVEYVRSIAIAPDQFTRIADAHNAAIAAERENTRQAGHANIRTNEMLTAVRRERDEAQKQLAAEREEHAKALLAKQTRIEIFQQQLAAERERCRELEEELVEAVKLLKLEDIDAAIAKVEARLENK